ncbi:hypothetical protein [Oceanobacillus picturae]|uniref:hypothetical protein n=1 Tax=Oceanobacillus picturae TaxID=171693 RepID=UPI000E689A68|nr:hypothetical protein [Oceanobacillus picturae]RIU93306.1 hypothetical protein D1864_07485 [Oceanobacillus picturae]
MADFKGMLNKLKQAQTDLNNKHRTNTLELVCEVYEELEQTTERYFCNYTKDTEHVQYYEARANRFKNMALAELQDLKRELTRQDCNVKRCNVLINNLINTKFHSKETHEFLSQWRSKVKRDFQQAYFAV